MESTIKLSTIVNFKDSKTVYEQFDRTTVENNVMGVLVERNNPIKHWESVKMSYHFVGEHYCRLSLSDPTLTKWDFHICLNCRSIGLVESSKGLIESIVKFSTTVNFKDSKIVYEQSDHTIAENNVIGVLVGRNNPTKHWESAKMSSSFVSQMKSMSFLNNEMSDLVQAGHVLVFYYDQILRVHEKLSSDQYLKLNENEDKWLDFCENPFSNQDIKGLTNEEKLGLVIAKLKFVEEDHEIHPWEGLH
ncbi:hypothetical protein QYF36_001890 [Acer negundo]|nr:hypothetical protein QYF36_001890 [Acer negundo]